MRTAIVYGVDLALMGEEGDDMAVQLDGFTFVGSDFS
jgi:hypothetical protein